MFIVGLYSEPLVNAGIIDISLKAGDIVELMYYIPAAQIFIFETTSVFY